TEIVGAPPLNTVRVTVTFCGEPATPPAVTGTTVLRTPTGRPAMFGTNSSWLVPEPFTVSQVAGVAGAVNAGSVPCPAFVDVRKRLVGALAPPNVCTKSTVFA